MKAFSLVELLVVVAIISILSSIAVPAYRSYMYRVHVQSAYNVLNQIRDQLVLEYQKTGVFPTSITYNGSQVTNNFSPVNSDSLTSVFWTAHYWGPNMWNYGDNLFMFGSVAGLDGYTHKINNGDTLTAYEPIPGGGAFANIYSVTEIAQKGTVVQHWCGMYNFDDGESVPLELQPSNCNCTSLSGALTGGSSPSGPC